MQTQKAVPGAVHTLVLAYVYLAMSQKALDRAEEAESSLQKGVDATKSPVLQRALDACEQGLSTPLERQG